jgi:tetratricopeptide (TPR) repeat protein
MTGDELSTLVDRLRRDRRRHPYRGRREYSQTAREVADLAEQLVTAGAAGQAVPELRKAADRITRALMYMDDSSGIVGDDLHQIMGLYARACAAAPPPPKSLAGWLVKMACDGPGWPRVQLREFAPALGEHGISELERLVNQRAQTVDPQSWSGGFAIRDLREQLAEVSGDLDRYVAVLARHLTSASQYERITLALRAAGRRSEAIDWARRGLSAKPGWPRTDQLRDTLVELLLEAGDQEAALAVWRDEFQRHPTATAFHHLTATAGW